MMAQPGPMVSGSHFLPKAPLLWVKWMPASAVMSRKVIWAWDAVAIVRKSKTHHGDTEARREALLAFGISLFAKGQRLRAKSGFSPWLSDSVVDCVVDWLMESRITFGPRES